MKKLSYLLVMALAAIISSCSGDMRSKMLDQVPDNSSIIVTADLKKCVSAMGMEYDKADGRLSFNSQMTGAFQALGLAGDVDKFENEFRVKGIEPGSCVVFSSAQSSVAAIFEVSDKGELLKTLGELYPEGDRQQIGDYVAVGRESSFENPVFLIQGRLAYMVSAKDLKEAARKLDKIKSSAGSHPLASWKRDLLLEDKAVNSISNYTVPLVSGNARFIAGYIEVKGNEAVFEANPYDKDGKKTNFTDEITLNTLTGNELDSLPRPVQFVMAGAMPSGIFDKPVIEQNLIKALSYSYDDSVSQKIMSTVKGLKAASMGFGRKEGAQPFDLAPDTWCGALDVCFATPQQAKDATSLFRSIIEKEERKNKEMYASYGIDYSGMGLVFEGSESLYTMTAASGRLKFNFGTTGTTAIASYNCQGTPGGYPLAKEAAGSTFYAAAIIPVDSPLGKTLMLDWDLELRYSFRPDGTKGSMRISATDGCLAGNILDWVAKLVKNSAKYDVSYYLNSSSGM